MNKKKEKTAAQMNDRTLSEKDFVSIIAFLQDFKTARNAYNIHENTAKRLFKHYLSYPVKAVIKARMTLPPETAKPKEGCLTLFSAIANYLLKRYSTDNNIGTVDANIRSFMLGSLTATDDAQQLWTKMLRWGSV